MGGDRRKDVVDPHGEAYAARGLFVTDASVFPTSVAVPAQLHGHGARDPDRSSTSSTTPTNT